MTPKPKHSTITVHCTKWNTTNWNTTQHWSVLASKPVHCNASHYKVIQSVTLQSDTINLGKAKDTTKWINNKRRQSETQGKVESSTHCLLVLQNKKAQWNTDCVHQCVTRDINALLSNSLQLATALYSVQCWPNWAIGLVQSTAQCQCTM